MLPNAEDRGRASRWWLLLPYAVFAALFAITFKRWILPFQDSGRDADVALRIAGGAVLYRDVEYYYGPLAPFLDAACLLVFGYDLDVLIGLRTVLGLLGVEALRRLACRVAPDAATAAAITAFIVAACCFDTGGAYPFPYSVAALEAAVGMWWALELALGAQGWRGAAGAGCVAVVAAAAKVEAIPMALGATGVALALRRPRGEAAVVVGVATAAVAVIILLPCWVVGVETMTRQGYLHLSHFPRPLLAMYEFSVLYGGMPAERFWGGGWWEVVRPSALHVGLVLGVLSWARARSAALTALAFLLGASTVRSSWNQDLHVLLPLAGVIGVSDVVRAFWRWWRGQPIAVERCGMAIVMLPALARQPFFFRNLIYGAFSAPLAFVTSLAWMARRVAAREAFVALLLGLTVAQGVQRWRDVGSQPDVWTELPRAALYLPVEESAFLKELVAELPKFAPPGGWTAVVPETGFVNFVTGLPNPFVEEQFYPEVQDAVAEDLMIRVLEERKPTLVISNRPLDEYSAAAYGEGFLDRFFAVVRRDYVAVRQLGGMPLAPHRQRHASAGLVLVPAERAAAVRGAQ